MRFTFHLLLIIFIVFSCKKSEKTQGSKSSDEIQQRRLESIKPLDQNQEEAFEALNTIQVSTDEPNRFYSTFPGTADLCLEIDTVMTISQAELLMALKHFLSNNCKNLSANEQETLAVTAVLAQEEYEVSICNPNNSSSNTEALQMTGTWLLRNILGKRDLVIHWDK